MYKRQVLEEPQGQGGFGYDPVFYLPEYKMTFAQMPGEEKNKISHRARAMAKCAAGLAEEMKGKEAVSYTHLGWHCI